MSRRSLVSRRPGAVVVAVALVGVVAVAATAAGGLMSGGGGERPTDAGREASQRFLEVYVDPDGRVVRRDQGGDTVSEGQAYAMLLAVAVDDRVRFDAAWDWAQANLVGDDGLMAWHWDDGRIVDGNPATDADVDAAHALLLAGERFDEPRYHDDGVALAAAVLTHETVTRAGEPVLVAGPWARHEDPPVLNPSYVAPRAYDVLLAATGDERWAQLTASGIEQVRGLTDGGRVLPSDWARLAEGGAEPAPAVGQDTVRYGYDAFRVLPRLAGACQPEARRLAAALWEPVAATVDDRAQSHGLDGAADEPGDNPVLLVAGAAAATAAGDERRGRDLLDEAGAVQRREPSYYLGAWVALGHLLLDGDLLGPCPDGGP